MKPFERFAVGIDSGPWSAFWRGAVGFLMSPVFRLVSGDYDSIWVTSVLFVGLLIALRVGPTVLRYALPFSAEAKQIWAARREVGKQHDSYAWQKLFWIGLGLLLYGAVGGGLLSGELAVTLFCLVGGGAGLLVWRGVRAIRPAQ